MQNRTLTTPRRRIAPLVAFVVILATAWVVFAHAQTQGNASQQPPTTTPEALFQDSTLTATTNTINATWLPVVTSTGKILYDDVTIQFAVADDGTLSVSSLQQNPSKKAIIDGFRSGTYLGPDDSTELIQVNGPGIAPGGATMWSIEPAKGYNGYLCPSDAQWWVGPIQQSPYWARIKKAGVPLKDYYYGVGTANTDQGCAYNGDWRQDSLLGFYMTSNGTMVISSFTNNSKDYSYVLDSKTYCLVGSKGCPE
jgi:hypothetical protein